MLRILSWLTLLGFLTWTYASGAAADPSPLLRYGAPDSNILQPPDNFLIGTPDRTRCPRWTLERLDSRALRGEASRDLANWHSDPRVPKEWRVTAKAYAEAEQPYDRGHLACAANHANNAAAMTATFTFSNTMPQVPSLNRGLWSQLERQVRDAARQPKTAAWVITMPIWRPNKAGTLTAQTIGEGVWIPTHCGKALLLDSDGTLSLQCWLLPNAVLAGKLDDYLVTGDQLEAASGLDIFSGLPDDTEDWLESQILGK